MATGDNYGKPAKSKKVKSIGQLRAEDSAGIEFGVGVDYGTDDDDATLHDGGNFAGVAVYDPTKGFTRDEDGNPSVVRKYYQGDPVEVAKEGVVTVPLEPATASSIDKGDDVYVVPSGQGDLPSWSQGYFTPDSGYNAIQAEFAESKTSLSSGDEVDIELNLPG